MDYGIEVIPMTLSVTFKVIPTASLSNVIFRTAMQQLTRFQLT